MPGGYHGRALLVDVTDAATTELLLDDDVLRRFVGGVGLASWLLHRCSDPTADALDASAPLVIALSPLVGTPLTTSAKFAVVAKSPLTNRLCDALASDRFAIELKACALDALVVTGACDDWSLLVIDDGDVRLESAADLVGLSSADAETKMRARLGEPFRFFGIGPAGERLVSFATISGDNRHAGRGGLGAVLGSKRIKGIAVRGSAKTELHDAPRVMELAKALSKRSLGPATAKYRELGTVTNLLVMNRLSALPTRNFSEGSFEGADDVSGESLHELPRVRKHCASCTIGCEHVFETKDGRGVRMEYEGLFALGPLCGVSDRDAVLNAAALCDDLGIDVISAGGTVAFAMECGARGLLDDAPTFGSADDLLRTLGQIGLRDGIGELLADGSRAAAERLGGDAPNFAMHVKGLELPGYEPRAMQTMALGLAVSTRGADHNRSGAYENDLAPGANRFAADDSKGPAAAASEVRAAVIDSLIVCKFLRGAFDDVLAEGAEMLAAVTGFDVGRDELEEAGRRIVNARKLWNVRAGWTPEEDTLPPRVLDEPLRTASGAEVTLSRDGLDRMIASYYRAHGWTDRGAVPDTLREALRLTDLADALPIGDTRP